MTKLDLVSVITFVSLSILWLKMALTVSGLTIKAVIHHTRWKRQGCKHYCDRNLVTNTGFKAEQSLKTYFTGVHCINKFNLSYSLMSNFPQNKLFKFKGQHRLIPVICWCCIGMGVKVEVGEKNHFQVGPFNLTVEDFFKYTCRHVYIARDENIVTL